MAGPDPTLAATSWARPGRIEIGLAATGWARLWKETGPFACRAIDTLGLGLRFLVRHGVPESLRKVTSLLAPSSSGVRVSLQIEREPDVVRRQCLHAKTRNEGGHKSSRQALRTSCAIVPQHVRGHRGVYPSAGCIDLFDTIDRTREGGASRLRGYVSNTGPVHRFMVSDDLGRSCKDSFWRGIGQNLLSLGRSYGLGRCRKICGTPPASSRAQEEARSGSPDETRSKGLVSWLTLSRTTKSGPTTRPAERRRSPPPRRSERSPSLQGGEQRARRHRPGGLLK